MKNSVLQLVVFFVFVFQNEARTQTVTDIDGNVYNTVTIGSQTWMKENLKTAHFRDGSSITEIENQYTWAQLNLNPDSPAWSYYDGDASYNTIYGKLYTGSVVAAPYEVCPTGWHIPSDAEFTQLVNYLGGDAIAGGKMKATTLWNSPNVGADNSSGFTGLPAGNRSYGNGLCYFMGENADFWSSSIVWPAFRIGTFALSNNYAIVQNGNIPAWDGRSIRCIKDNATSLPNEGTLDLRLQIYPNPATTKIYIDCSGKENLKIQIYSMIGECVLQNALSSGKSEIEINSLPSGVYVIQITSADWTEQFKLNKE